MNADFFNLPDSSRCSGRFQVLGLAGFLLVGLFTISHHEMWGDELQHWSIAQASGSPAEIFHNLRYESSPALWHMLLYGITRVTQNPVSMQILHVLLAALAAWVFLRWSPFSKLQKLLFVFGYFPAFEYCIISRHYVLGMLLLFGFLALSPWDGKRAVAAAVVLFLLAQTGFFGLVLAVACAAAMVTRYWPIRDRAGLVGDRALAVALIITAAGCVWSYIQIYPHRDSALHRVWDFINFRHALQAGTTVWRSFVPLPLFQIEFWNTNVLDSFQSLHSVRHLPGLLVQDVLSAVLVIGSALYFRRRPEALVLFVLVALACLGFFYIKKLGFMRHHGHLYLAWIGALWLTWSPRPDSAADEPSERRRTGRLLGVGPLVTLVLAVHVAAAVYAGVMDYRFPFSAAKQATQWIRAEGRQDNLLIGPPHFGAYLDRDVYVVPNRRFGRFTLHRFPYRQMEPPELVELAEQLQRRHEKEVVLARRRPIVGAEAEAKLETLAEFTRPIVPYERWYLYSLRRLNRSEGPSAMPKRAAEGAGPT